MNALHLLCHVQVLQATFNDIEEVAVKRIHIDPSKQPGAAGGRERGELMQHLHCPAAAIEVMRGMGYALMSMKLFEPSTAASRMIRVCRCL